MRTMREKAEAVVQACAAECGVEAGDIYGSSRSETVVIARALSCKILRERTPASYPEIAEAMLRPNHSTCITACKRIGMQMERAVVLYGRQMGRIATVRELHDGALMRCAWALSAEYGPETMVAENDEQRWERRTAREESDYAEGWLAAAWHLEETGNNACDVLPGALPSPYRKLGRSGTSHRGRSRDWWWCLGWRDWCGGIDRTQQHETGAA